MGVDDILTLHHVWLSEIYVTSSEHFPYYKIIKKRHFISFSPDTIEFDEIQEIIYGYKLLHRITLPSAWHFLLDYHCYYPGL